MTIITIIIAIATLGTFLIASVYDLSDMRVPYETWYPMIAVCGIPAILAITSTRVDILPIAILVASFYMIGRIGAMGGADAWGMIFALLFFVVPLGVPVIDFVEIIIGACVIGIVIVLIKVYKTGDWNTKIPFIPAITGALIGYFLFFLASPLM